MDKKILLVNDDGIDAPGLYELAEMLLGFGTVFIAAPEKEQSGVGHAITIREPIRVRELSEKPEGVERMSIRGTPADVVKFTIRHRLDFLPDLVVSGPNTGPNVGVNVLYSGTVAAAIEANFWGVSSVAVSSDLQEGTYDWEPCRHFGKIVIARALEMEQERREHPEAMLRRGAARPFMLNLNVPALPLEKIKGLRLTRHGASGFSEYFEPHHSEPGLYSINGTFESNDPHDGFDTSAILAGYASLTALDYEMTDFPLQEKLGKYF